MVGVVRGCQSVQVVAVDTVARARTHFWADRQGFENAKAANRVASGAGQLTLMRNSCFPTKTTARKHRVSELFKLVACQLLDLAQHPLDFASQPINSSRRSTHISNSEVTISFG